MRASNTSYALGAVERALLLAAFGAQITPSSIAHFGVRFGYVTVARTFERLTHCVFVAFVMGEHNGGQSQRSERFFWRGFPFAEIRLWALASDINVAHVVDARDESRPIMRVADGSGGHWIRNQIAGFVDDGLGTPALV